MAVSDSDFKFVKLLFLMLLQKAIDKKPENLKKTEGLNSLTIFFLSVLLGTCF
jgi:hypothetical protein